MSLVVTLIFAAPIVTGAFAGLDATGRNQEGRQPIAGLGNRGISTPLASNGEQAFLARGCAYRDLEMLQPGVFGDLPLFSRWQSLPISGRVCLTGPARGECENRIPLAVRAMRVDVDPGARPRRSRTYLTNVAPE